MLMIMIKWLRLRVEIRVFEKAPGDMGDN